MTYSVTDSATNSRTSSVGASVHAVRALIANDLRLYLSSRRALLMNILAPILIAGFFGSLFATDADRGPLRIPIAVVDLDRSDISNRAVAAMKADTAFEIQEIDEAAAHTLVQKGKVRASVVIPAGFGSQIVSALFNPDRKPVIEVNYDPSQSMTLAVVNGLLVQHVLEGLTQAAVNGNAGSIVLGEARRRLDASTRLPEAQKRNLSALLDDAGRAQAATPPGAPLPSTAPPQVAGAAAAGAPGSAASGANNDGTVPAGGDAAPAGAVAPPALRLQLPFATHDSAVFAAGDRPYNSYAHSFAGMSVQFILFMGVDLGVGLLLARRLGLWKRLRAAPLSRATLIGSRVASGALIALILLLIIYAAAMAFFGVRIDGSVLGFAGIAIAFALLTASFGMLIAALGKTPEATRGLAIFVTLLLVMLSGAWVPSFVFPEWLQHVSLFVPSRWAVDGLDAMTWRGLGLDAAVAPIATMLAFSVAFAGLAIWRFDWEE